MATAEAKTQRKEEEARRHEPSQPEGSSSSSSRRSRRGGTRQLDFFQAMSDFKSMFPTLDDEVIEAVLRANDGAVDATIDQLLTMTIDEDITSKVSEAELGSSFPGDHVEGAAAAEDSPPSYSEAIRAQAEADQAQSIWTTPIGQPFPSSPRNVFDSSTDSLSLSITEPKGAMAQLSPGGLLASSGSGSGLSPLSSANSNSSPFAIQRSNSSDQNTRRKVEFKNWNPPMLGNLPDDFLRLIPPESSGGNNAKSDFDKTSNLTTTPVSVMSVNDVKPKTQKSRSKSEKILARSFSSSPKEKESKTRGSDKKSKSSDKMSRSFSLVEQSGSARQKVARSHSGRSKDRPTSSNMSPSHRTMTIETHDFSKDMLEERMKENERRRKKTSARADPELAQYLEDERLAIALQNSEFLQELRSNEDFMKTLQKDRASKKPVSETPEAKPVMMRPPDDAHQGYGDDTDKTLDAFPFSQDVQKSKDDDAELRRQLSGMGKASRKQLATLAKKFFKRKKKTSKQILGEKLAPSMMNLLEDEEEEEEEDLFSDRRYGNSPPEIEPLASVPSHRTVQRPAYQPDGVTTYFDNKSVDIV